MRSSNAHVLVKTRARPATESDGQDIALLTHRLRNAAPATASLPMAWGGKTAHKGRLSQPAVRNAAFRKAVNATVDWQGADASPIFEECPRL